jgi:nucleoside-diphosphate-sugar epimerase
MLNKYFPPTRDNCFIAAKQHLSILTNTDFPLNIKIPLQRPHSQKAGACDSFYNHNDGALIMRLFVTGATGFIGSLIVRDLIQSGHTVLGLARSNAAAGALVSAGAQAHRGDLKDSDSLRKGAAISDGVIHTAFIHDFSRFNESCEIDRQAIEALGSALAGSNRPLVVTSGTAIVAPGRLITESDTPDSAWTSIPRIATEEAAASVARRGVRVAVVRLPPSVHGDGDHGFIPILIRIAREKGISAYVGDGGNVWPAVHRLDAAALYRLAMENATAGARYHGVAEEGILFRDIATIIGRRLDVPVVSMTADEATVHFGWFARIVGRNNPASSRQTQAALGWKPKQIGLLEDLDRPGYFFSQADTTR